jgi:tyrosyl-tRNA synthetase
MIRKKIGFNAPSCCFSVPLLLKPDGTKFGKSENGSIFLDKEMTPIYDMYQFFINQPDIQIEELLKKFTFLSKDAITEILLKHKSNPSERIGQKTLAKEVICDIHGIDEYKKIVDAIETVFLKNRINVDFEKLFNALKIISIKFNIKKNKYQLDEILEITNIASSKSEARRLIKSNAIKLNGKIISDVNYIVDFTNLINNKFSYIEKNRKFVLMT